MKKYLGTLGLCAVLALVFVPLGLGQQAEQPKPVAVTAETLPPKFDLRDAGVITPIKKQQGGTCWTHGTMAAIECNLLISGVWKKCGMNGIPCCSEYHLDWWNGFNRHNNEDLEDAAKHPSGLKVHVGGDYRVSASYISRGDGVVLVPMDKDNKPDTTSWYKAAPPRKENGYKKFYVRDIEWFVIGPNLENIDVVKKRIMTEGAIGTAYCVSKSFISKDFVHYQPLDSKSKPNHAVAIVGWDDTKVTTDDTKKAPKPGAWLIKNSWGTTKGDKGYYWISYYDKVCCRDEEMGAVSFRNIEPMAYDHIYFHDYHGWRDTMKNVSKAFNAFTATDKHQIRSVSFYTAKDNVTYTVKIYKSFDKGQLKDEVTYKTGIIPVTGFHTIDLNTPVNVQAKEKFYVYLELSSGGHAIDRTSEIPVLLQPDKKTEQPKKKKEEPGLKGPNGPLVMSRANPGESYYFDGTWKDLYDHKFENPNWAMFDRTANFCMKALAVNGNGATSKK